MYFVLLQRKKNILLPNKKFRTCCRGCCRMTSSAAVSNCCLKQKGQGVNNISAPRRLLCKKHYITRALFLNYFSAEYCITNYILCKNINVVQFLKTNKLHLTGIKASFQNIQLDGVIDNITIIVLDWRPKRQGSSNKRKGNFEQGTKALHGVL